MSAIQGLFFVPKSIKTLESENKRLKAV